MPNYVLFKGHKYYKNIYLTTPKKKKNSPLNYRTVAITFFYFLLKLETICKSFLVQFSPFKTF